MVSFHENMNTLFAVSLVSILNNAKGECIPELPSHHKFHAANVTFIATN